MPLTLRIQDDLKQALLSGDKFTTETLRGLKSVILNEEIAQGRRKSGLEDTEIERIFAKEAKKRVESAELFEKGGNQEAADKELREKALIQQYLPEQMDEDELQQLVEQTINDLEARGNPQAMGKVVGAVRARAGSQADGAIIARLVKEALNNK